MANLNPPVVEDEDDRIITISNNLEDLDKEYQRWLLIPYDHKKHTDAKCLAKYGCTNTELYLKLRAQLLKNHKLEDPVEIKSVPEAGSVNPVTIDNNFTDTKENRALKIQKSNSITDKDHNVVIINDFVDDNYDNYTIEQLIDKYNKYLMLPQNQKELSDNYSFRLWGKSVPEMFKYMKAKINRFKVDSLTRTLDDRTMNIQIAAMKGFDSDKLALEIGKLDSCINSSKRTFCESVYLKTKSESIDYQPYRIKMDKQIVPILTPDEYHDLTGVEINDPYNYLNIDKEKMYYDTIYNLQNQLNNNTDDSNSVADKIIKLGWNPYIGINGNTIKYAQSKQKDWLDTVIPDVDVIDISRYKTEFTNENLKVDKVNSILHPVFIVIKYDNYSHNTTDVGITLDSIKNVYTWKDGIGCIKDNFYDNNTDNTSIKIACFLVDDNIYDRIQDIIENIVNNFKESFVNINDKDCLLRVFFVLIYNFNKLLGDSDIEHIKLINNPRIYILFDGSNKEFNCITNAYDKIFVMINRYNTSCKEVSESEIMDTISSGLIENLFITTSKNKVAESHLSNIRNILHPESVISINEVKIPFGLDDKGLYINFPKDLQKEYEEAHRLLMLYGSNNMDGIKHELAHLYYIDWVIERKLKYTSKGSKKYKQLIDLRARVLNDFKKYFKIVCANDSKFDFMKYLKTTEYYTKRMEIDYKTMEGIGKIISTTSK